MSKNIEQLFSDEFDNFAVEPSEEEFLQLDKIISKRQENGKKRIIFYFSSFSIAAILLLYLFMPSKENKPNLINSRIEKINQTNNTIIEKKSNNTTDIKIKESIKKNNIELNKTQNADIEQNNNNSNISISPSNKTSETITESKLPLSNQPIQLETRPMYKTHYHIKTETNIIGKDSVK